MAYAGVPPPPQAISMNGLVSPINSVCVPPPTPAPSPGPFMPESGGCAPGCDIVTITPTHQDASAAASAWSSLAPAHVQHLSGSSLNALLTIILRHLTPAQLMDIASQLPARLKRDFIADLPPEIALHILSFVDDVKTLARASQVSRAWRVLANDEAPWRILCARRGFEPEEDDGAAPPHGRVGSRGRSLLSTSAGPPGTDVNVGAMTSVMNLWSATSRYDTLSESENFHRPLLLQTF